MAFHRIQFALQRQDVIGFTAEQRTAIEMQCGVSIVDRGNQLYENVEHPRFKNFYGYAQVMSGEFVTRTLAINHLNQEVIHWRDPNQGLLESIGCYFKLYGSLDTPPVAIATNTVKVRQRFTSVRIKLRPGVLANFSLAYETGEPLCGGNLLEPPAQQGQPINGNNETYSPGNRPASQGGDSTDFTTNDGDYEPGINEGRPPGDAGGGNKTWKVSISGFNPDCSIFAYSHNTTNTDPDAIVTATSTPTGQPQICARPDKKVEVFVNGASQGIVGSGGDCNFDYIYYA